MRVGQRMAGAEVHLAPNSSPERHAIVRVVGDLVGKVGSGGCVWVSASPKSAYDFSGVREWWVTDGWARGFG